MLSSNPQPLDSSSLDRAEPIVQQVHSSACTSWDYEVAQGVQRLLRELKKAPRGMAQTPRVGQVASDVQDIALCQRLFV